MGGRRTGRLNTARASVIAQGWTAVADIADAVVENSHAGSATVALLSTDCDVERHLACPRAMAITTG